MGNVSCELNPNKKSSSCSGNCECSRQNEDLDLEKLTAAVTRRVMESLKK